MTHAKDGLTLGAKIMHIGLIAYEHIGKPEYIDILYDLDAKAIKIVPVKEVGRKVTVLNEKYNQISCRLSTTGMPIGFYRYDKMKDIFIYNE